MQNGPFLYGDIPSYVVFALLLCQVHLHSYNDIPLVSDLGFFVEPGKHSLVSVDYSRVSQDGVQLDDVNARVI